MDDDYDGGDSGPAMSQEDLVRQRKQLEADLQFEAGKADYLQDILAKEIIRGKPRLRMVYEAKYFMIFLSCFLLYVAVTKIDKVSLCTIEGFRATLLLQAMPPIGEYATGSHTLKDMTTFSQVFDWLAHVLYPSICTTGNYGYVNEYNKVLYGIRIRQIRVKPSSKSIITGSLTSFKTYTMSTHQGYSTGEEEKGPWMGDRWYSATELNNAYMGQDEHLLSLYTENYFPGSGYIVDIPLNGSTTEIQNTILNLRDSGWVDQSTRALIVQFNTFNPVNGKFVVTTVLSEKNIAGMVVSSARFNVFEMLMFNMHSASSIIKGMLMVWIIGITIIFTIGELRQTIHPNLTAELEHVEEDEYATLGEEAIEEVVPWCQRPFVYLWKFRSPWEVLHVANICMFIYAFYIRVIWYTTPEVQNFSVQSANNNFMNMLPMAHFKQFENSLTALNVCLSILKLFKFLRLSTALNILYLTLIRSGGLLVGFMVMVMLVFSGFAVMGNVVFGQSMRDYYSFWASASTLFQMLLGDFNYTGLVSANHDVAISFFYLYMVVVFLTLINMFISILQESYTDVSATIFAMKEPAPVATYLEILFGRWAQEMWDASTNAVAAELEHLQDEAEGAQNLDDVLKNSHVDEGAISQSHDENGDGDAGAEGDVPSANSTAES